MTPASSSSGNSVFETGTEHLLCRREGDHVVVLTLNRPERRNALSSEMYEGFRSVLPAVAEDPNVRVLVVTGAGGAFCAGGDVKAMNERNNATSNSGAGESSVEGKVADLRMRQREVSLALAGLPQPVVALIPGPVAGAGLSIALSADIRLATQSAIFVTAFSSVGGSGDFGGSWFLSNLVGPAKAKELYFMSPRLSSSDALDLGIVNRVFDDEDFEATALGFCHDLAARPPLAVRYMKENINRAAYVGLADALDHEAAAMIRTMSTDDHKEAAAAFVEKRTAHFQGR